MIKQSGAGKKKSISFVGSGVNGRQSERKICLVMHWCKAAPQKRLKISPKERTQFLLHSATAAVGCCHCPICGAPRRALRKCSFPKSATIWSVWPALPQSKLKSSGLCRRLSTIDIYWFFRIISETVLPPHVFYGPRPRKIGNIISFKFDFVFLNRLKRNVRILSYENVY